MKKVVHAVPASDAVRIEARLREVCVSAAVSKEASRGATATALKEARFGEPTTGVKNICIGTPVAILMETRHSFPAAQPNPAQSGTPVMPPIVAVVLYNIHVSWYIHFIFYIIGIATADWSLGVSAVAVANGRVCASAAAATAGDETTSAAAAADERVCASASAGDETANAAATARVCAAAAGDDTASAAGCDRCAAACVAGRDFWGISSYASAACAPTSSPFFADFEPIPFP